MTSPAPIKWDAPFVDEPRRSENGCLPKRDLSKVLDKNGKPKF